MVRDLLELPTNLRCVLGVVGDKGSLGRAEGTVRDDARRFLIRAGIEEEMLGDMVKLVDANARVGDVSLVEQAVLELSRVGEDPEAILNHPIWVRNARILESEIDRQLQGEDEVRDGVVIREFESRLDIVSAVARRIASSRECRIAVAINSGFLSHHDQVYVRRGTGVIDASAIIQLAHRQGYSAGGKEEVVGIVVPKKDKEGFVRELLRRLES